LATTETTFDLSKTAQAALDSDGPVLVLGGPGSGKTTLSLLKAQRLIPELEPGQEILFLSFSRAAVHQVMVRCAGVLTTAERRRISVKTYHAFCMEILRAHGRLLTAHRPRILFPRQERLLRSKFDGPWAVERQRLADEDGRYAFDQFAGGAANLLSRAEAVRQLLADRYPVIILDEFQDTNNAQWALVQQLGEGSRLITLADPDQRIFDYDKTVDPERLNQLRELLKLAEFDLGGENHRSPDAEILAFANAILQNRPLPKTADVNVFEIYPNVLDAGIHAALVWMLGALSKAGIKRPSVAVLCRSNALVWHVSQVLSAPHTYNGRAYKPVEHDVAWDAELAAAAANVVASMLEWSANESAARVANTLDAIAEFYDHKNAGAPSNSSVSSATSYRKAAEKVRASKTPGIADAKHLLDAASDGFSLSGVPAHDWKQAQAILEGHKKLEPICRFSRLVRLFGARDEIGRSLADRWNASETYGSARELVRRALDQAQLMAARTEHHGVVLMNMHKSKGKEFHGVMLVEGPHVGKFFDTREPAPYYPSRMLLRVAITRAQHRVVILRPPGGLRLTGVYA